jgi:hypothetical protein
MSNFSVTVSMGVVLAGCLVLFGATMVKWMLS